jgi:alkylation response protein AidB-like acyl-CoA dehydrogenase
MFVPALKNLGTEEQQARWVPKATNCSIIGAYAQTELGHGTFIRGLQTTSTFDPKSREFVINSPSITAYKVSDFVDDNCCRPNLSHLFSSGGPVALVTQLITP